MRDCLGMDMLYQFVEKYTILQIKGVGAADKAAIQRVKVPPYQLLVSDT